MPPLTQTSDRVQGSHCLAGCKAATACFPGSAACPSNFEPEGAARHTFDSNVKGHARCNNSEAVQAKSAMTYVYVLPDLCSLSVSVPLSVSFLCMNTVLFLYLLRFLTLVFGLHSLSLSLVFAGSVSLCYGCFSCYYVFRHVVCSVPSSSSLLNFAQIRGTTPH